MKAHSVRDHRKIEIVAEKNEIPKNIRPKRSVLGNFRSYERYLSPLSDQIWQLDLLQEVTE